MNNRPTPHPWCPVTANLPGFALRFCAIAAVITFATIGLPQTAALADSGSSEWEITKPSSSDRSVDFSIMGGFSSVGRGLAGGARLAFPIMGEGLIDEINDGLFIELGGHYSWNWRYHKGKQEWYHNWGLAIPVQARWQFYVTPKWEVFAALGVSFRFYSDDDDSIRWMGFIPYPAGGVGALYKLHEHMALRLDAGSEALSAGFTWKF